MRSLGRGSHFSVAASFRCRPKRRARTLSILSNRLWCFANFSHWQNCEIGWSSLGNHSIDWVEIKGRMVFILYLILWAIDSQVDSQTAQRFDDLNSEREHNFWFVWCCLDPQALLEFTRMSCGSVSMSLLSFLFIDLSICRFVVSNILINKTRRKKFVFIQSNWPVISLWHIFVSSSSLSSAAADDVSSFHNWEKFAKLIGWKVKG